LRILLNRRLFNAPVEGFPWNCVTVLGSGRRTDRWTPVDS